MFLGLLYTKYSMNEGLLCCVRTGFQHEVLAAFCKCEPEAVTLVRYNMWPATPKNPTLAIHQQLLEWLEALLLEGCIGVDTFCRAIDVKRGNRISRQVCFCSLASLAEVLIKDSLYSIENCTLSSLMPLKNLGEILECFTYRVSCIP